MRISLLFHRRRYYHCCFASYLWISSTTLANSFSTTSPLSSPPSSSSRSTLALQQPRHRTFSSSSSSSSLAFVNRRQRSQTTTFVNKYYIDNSLTRTNPASIRTSRLNMSTDTTTKETSKNMLRVALCQIPVTEDKAINHQTASKYIDDAVKKEGAQLLVLPEIWNSPYATAAFPEYAEVLPPTPSTTAQQRQEDWDYEQSPSAKLLRSKAIEHSIWLVGGSIPELEDGKYYNTCLVFDPDGTLVAKHRKVHLFDINVPGKITFYESDTLSPGQTYTFFDIPNYGTVGVGICYDIRFAEYALILCQKHNCRILIYPGAFNLTTGPAHWELLQRGRAVDNQCYVLTASPARTEAPPPDQAGKYPHYTAWGHSTAVSPWGEVVGTTGEKEGLVVVDLDLNLVDEMRSSIPILQQKRHDLYTLSETSASTTTTSTTK